MGKVFDKLIKYFIITFLSIIIITVVIALISYKYDCEAINLGRGWYGVFSYRKTKVGFSVNLEYGIIYLSAIIAAIIFFYQNKRKGKISKPLVDSGED